MNSCIKAALLSCALVAITSCEDTHRQQREELAKEAADYVADVARRDPERAGKVGVARALHVRALALGRTRAMSHRARFDAIAPICRPHLIPAEHLELISTHFELRGTREFSWQQRMDTRQHDGATHMIIDERYTDDETILPGERYTEIIWSDRIRWSRSARSPQARFVKDPYPERQWRAFSTGQRTGQEELLGMVESWQRGEQGYVLGKPGEGVSLGCLLDEDYPGGVSTLDELKDVLAMQYGTIQHATLQPEEFEGIQGWRVSVTWRLGERGMLDASVFRGRRAMTQDELDALAVPADAMEAVVGQGERVKPGDGE